jgi:hypothetical protein
MYAATRSGIGTWIPVRPENRHRLVSAWSRVGCPEVFISGNVCICSNVLGVRNDRDAGRGVARSDRLANSLPCVPVLYLILWF